MDAISMKGLSEHVRVSGVIIFDQKTDDGTPFIEVLKRQAIIPGIKVDRDAMPLFLSEEEVTTQGEIMRREVKKEREGSRRE